MDNSARFQMFIAERLKAEQWADLISKDGTCLSKSKIVVASNIPRSTFYQCAELKDAYAQIEAKLRKKGVLKEQSEPPLPKRADVELLEMIFELDKLHMRLLVLSEGRERLHARISEFESAVDAYQIGGTK